VKITRTDLLRPGEPKSDSERLWIYNGLDCCVTLEVFEAIFPQLDNLTGSTYALSRALQGPVLEMNLRGVRIDESERRRAIDGYRDDTKRLERNLYRIVHDGVGYPDFCDTGKTKAWRSNAHVARLLYDVLKLPEIRKRNERGELARTVNRDALERLQIHFLAEPIIAHILSLRDIGKKISVLETEIDSDGRLRTSYNIAGTTTGRFSSAFNDFGTGGNLQNIEERLRRVVIPDPGMKFANIDLEQADSRNIGALCWNVFRDPTYLNACESGDLHTAVARMSRPGLPWTGDLKADRATAEQPFYRHHGLRHMCKVLGHGTNYLGSPFEMSKHTKIEQSVIKEFQATYFQAFPAIQRLHAWTAEQLASTGNLITPFGRKRWFFGKRDERDTLKQAVAHLGQSMTADEMNHALLGVWRLHICDLLLQVHDSVLIQYPEEKENEIIPQVLAAMRVPLELEGGRQFVVPLEVQVGWNWGKRDPRNPDDNPYGLSKWPDERKKPIAKAGQLDRKLSGVH
jgi:DNA polymerase I